MYGLCDAPLLWQMSLKFYLVSIMDAQVSVHDDCSFTFKRKGQLIGLATAHVDDTNFAASQKDLDFWRSQLEQRFGPVTRQTLPFQHVGITYTRSPNNGYILHQREFCLAMKPFPFCCGQLEP